MAIVFSSPNFSHKDYRISIVAAIRIDLVVPLILITLDKRKIRLDIDLYLVICINSYKRVNNLRIVIICKNNNKDNNNMLQL